MFRLSRGTAAVLAAACTFADPTVATSASPCAASRGELPAASLAPPTLLAGEGFVVEPCAKIVGHMAQFRLQRLPAPGTERERPAPGEPDPDRLVVDSLDLLELRVAEMAVLGRLEAAGAAGTAGGAAWSSLKQTGESLGQVATRPVESVVGLPAGALRFLGRRAGDLGRQAANAGERAGEAFDEDTAAEGPALRPGAVAPEAAEPAPWWARGGRQVATLGKRWLGYNSARRELGERLGVDPYSGNPWLDAEMDRLAWSALVGRRGVGLGLGQIGGVGAQALGQTGRIHRMVWARAPEEVTAWNRQRLAPLRCAAEAQDEFFDNARYSPTLQTQAVDALLALAPQQGCDLFLRLATAVEREVEARYVVDALQLLVAAGPRFPSRFEAVGGLWVLRDGEDRLLLPLPVDVLGWTPDTAALFDDPVFDAVADKRALLGREASPRARAALLGRGWSVVEGALGPAREAAGPAAAPPP